MQCGLITEAFHDLWGDNSTLLAAASIWNIQINILSDTIHNRMTLQKGRKDYWHKIPESDKNIKQKLYLVQHGELHYSSTTNINNRRWNYFDYLNKIFKVKVDNNWIKPKPEGIWK